LKPPRILLGSSSSVSIIVVLFQCSDNCGIQCGTFCCRDKERNPNLPTLRQAAADMILTYQRQIGDVGGALEELRKDLNAAQEVFIPA
jgi:hypothetical protein